MSARGFFTKRHHRLDEAVASFPGLLAMPFRESAAPLVPDTKVRIGASAGSVTFELIDTVRGVGFVLREGEP
jgi:hypothetical protein